MRRLIRAVTAAVVVAAAVPGLAAPASAEPYADAVTELPGTPAISWTQLGLSDRVDLIGANQPSDTAVPVPTGVGPAVLSGQIGSIVNVTDGRVDVQDGRGVLLGSVPVPAGATTLPFSVDIAAAQVIDGKARLSFILRDAGQATNTCTQPPDLTLTQLTTTFSGATPDPVTVAGFLPGYLDRIVISVGPEPTVYQQQAALDLVAKLTRLYRSMPVRIDVTTGDVTLEPWTSTTRVIEVRDGTAPGITVENAGTPNAVLAITGTGEALVTQVGLFADRRMGLAQSDTAVLLAAHDGTDMSSTVKSFDQLGITGQTSVVGTTTMYAGFDVATFGVGPVSGATVHLKAHYTPVVGGEGSVLVRSGATVLASRTLDGSGTLDVTGDIPAEAITSNVGVALELRYIPRQECAPMNDRVTFVLDPRSTVTVTPGTNNRGGFPSLPMAMTPDFDVAIDSPDHLRFAAQAINLMAQRTQVTLRPTVTDFDEATSGSSALVVVSGGRRLADAQLAPPMLPGVDQYGADTVDVGNVADADNTLVDLHAPLGMIQAFTQNGRSVLAVTGTGDWSLVDAGFDHVRSLPDRWGSLTGDVLATGIAGDTVTLSVNEGGSMAHQPAPGAAWSWWAWGSAGIVLVAALGAGATVLIRRRA